MHQLLQSIIVLDSLRKMEKKNQKNLKKLRSIRENSGYRRGSICEDRLNVAKCNRVLRKGKCVTKKATKKCQKTCGLCGGKIQVSTINVLYQLINLFSSKKVKS